jgi:hypothetical protein
MADQGPAQEARGLAVAKCTVRAVDPTVLDVIYYCDAQQAAGDHAPRRIALRGDAGPIEFPGHFSFEGAGEGLAASRIQLAVARKGVSGFVLAAHAGDAPLGLGLGLADPQDDSSVLISWWTGAVQPYGIVKYTIRDARTITAHYISAMSPDVPGGGRAIGDTSGGHAGRYSLTYEEANGRTWGPYDWVLTARGEVIDLAWSQDGRVVCRGFGFVDPDEPASILVNYIAV